jgi:DNA-binding NarL/FixJ family response regulator
VLEREMMASSTGSTGPPPCGRSDQATHAGSSTLLLVDDQPHFLRLARARLTREPGLRVVGEATSGEEAIRLVPPLNPEAVLLDVEMPGMDGFEAARRLRALAPALRIILTSGSDDPRYGTVASRLGAVFLPKKSLSIEAVLRLLRP